MYPNILTSEIKKLKTRENEITSSPEQKTIHFNETWFPGDRKIIM